MSATRIPEASQKGKLLLHNRLFLALAVCLAVFGCRASSEPKTTLLRIREEARNGQLDVALRDVDAALAKYQGRIPEWAARFRVQKAHILVLRGAYNEALQLLREPVPASLANSETAVRRKMVQGIAHDYLQKYEEGDRDLTEASQLAAFYSPELLGDVLQARGNLEISRKEYLAAAADLQQALQLDRRQNLVHQEANVLGSLGYLAMWQEHYDEAIEWFKIGLQKSQAVGSEYGVAKILGNIGWNYWVIGDLENAEDTLKKAEKASVKAGLPGDQVKWLNDLSGVYFQMSRYDIARPTSEEALRLARNVGDNRDITSCLNSAADIAVATGHFEAAEKYNREALKIEQAGLDQFGVTSSTIIAGRIAARQKQYREAEKAFQKVIRDPSVGTPQRWEAQAGLAQVHAAMGRAAVAERDFGESINTISKAWNDLKSEEFRLSFLSSAIQFYDTYISFLIGRNRPLDALRIADLSRAQTLELGLSSGKNGKVEQSASLRPEGIARRLNATLLFYWLGEERSHLWVITARGISLLPLPGRAEIDATVKSYLDTFTLPRDPLETGNADAKKLYATLIQPAEKRIPKNSRVILLPDRGLNSLNFETLIVPGPEPHYWIEDVTLTTANSLSLLSRASLSAPDKTTNLFLMGNALSASPDFPPLPQAGKEVGLVEKYFSEEGRTVLTGAQATASHFLSGKPETFSYLHFATHGTASTSHPLDSAVILSPEGDSFKLYARDIVQHPLHAYLVTISACNGSGLRTYAGEGLVGLAWAFLRAGAHNVIAGLWEVSNASTPQLMDELYKGLNSGKDPAAALRAAKLTLVHSKGNYKKPFYWAPFQLYAGS